MMGDDRRATSVCRGQVCFNSNPVIMLITHLLTRNPVIMLVIPVLVGHPENDAFS